MKRLALFTVNLLCISFLSGCLSPDKMMAQKMLTMYADNQKYVILHGVITECNDNAVVIECEALKSYISYEDGFCDYYVYSDYTLDLNVGDSVDFITVPYHFYNGHKLPIVAISVDGNALLDFTEGKNNLLSWVKESFK